jgi:hypothetical protein
MIRMQSERRTGWWDLAECEIPLGYSESAVPERTVLTNQSPHCVHFESDGALLQVRFPLNGHGE